MTNKKPTKRKGESLSISGLEGLVKNEFIVAALTDKVTQSQFLATLLNNYKNFYSPLNKEEQKLMQQAMELAPSTLKKKIKRAALRYAADIVNFQKVDKHTIDINKKNSSSAADARADALLQIIFEHNDSATNWVDKILITKTSVLKCAAEQKEFNPGSLCIGKNVLDRCLERNKTLINDHHKKHELRSDHNTKAHYERLKMKNIKNKEIKTS